MNPKFQAPRGTLDYTPPGSLALRRLQELAAEVFSRYGFLPLETPIFESTDLFTRSIGEETDIVSKEMYTFPDKKGRSLTLRPEGTASAVRAYLERGLEDTGFSRFWYFGPMFRYERPQAGRTRQFFQLGVEAFADAGPASDAEVIECFWRLCEALGLEGLQVKLNSVGCAACRGAYTAALKERLRGREGDVCEQCRTRLEKNPLRILDCKVAADQELYRDLPKLVDSLCEACAAHFAGVRGNLELLGVAYVLEPRLVRGLDYYTRTAFEITSGALGAQDAVGGGGRYDLLVEQFGGRPTPAVGFAAGVERLLMVAEKTAASLPAPYAGTAYIAALGERVGRRALELARDIRTEKLSCLLDLGPGGLGKKLKAASRLACGWALILGDAELDSGNIAVKDLASGEQKLVPLEGLVTYLKERRGHPCRTS
ncbi:MAG: histidine--tRNA ligase [Candidatus Wallbacteria bacterium]|nr:histidine--tRNA ligase [Candidatus Wallbacteria bacterium]